MVLYMSEELIIKHCAPTLAGMKTGNMFICSYSDMNEMHSSVRYWNRLLTKKGVRILPLQFNNNRAMIYIYRPSRLSHDLQDKSAFRLLSERGYSMETPERCIVQLIRRISECKEFPHEIGLFLGYPPEDVCGFIEGNKQCCKFSGCLKVYGDAEKARKTFEKYKKCTSAYYKQYAKGKSIERLTVAG